MKRSCLSGLLILAILAFTSVNIESSAQSIKDSFKSEESTVQIAEPKTKDPLKISRDDFISRGMGDPSAPVPAHTEEESRLKIDIKDNYDVDLLNTGGLYAAKWSPGQLEAFSETMAALPEGYRQNLVSAERRTYLEDNGMVPLNATGGVSSAAPTHVMLADGATRGKGEVDAKTVFQGDLVHEIAHTYHEKNPQILTDWEKQFWGDSKYSPQTSSVSKYGNSQPKEDFAESVSEYYLNGKNMKTQQPDRYAFIKDNVMGGQEYETDRPSRALR